MEFNPYIRTPFTVEATEITDENIAEIAKLIGTLKRDEESGKYILVNRRVVPNISRAYVGWWVTRYNNAYHCYAPEVFEKQFEPYTAVATFAMPLPDEEVSV